MDFHSSTIIYNMFSVHEHVVKYGWISPNKNRRKPWNIELGNSVSQNNDSWRLAQVPLNHPLISLCAYSVLLQSHANVYATKWPRKIFRYRGLFISNIRHRWSFIGLFFLLELFKPKTKTRRSIAYILTVIGSIAFSSRVRENFRSRSLRCCAISRARQKKNVYCHTKPRKVKLIPTYIIYVNWETSSTWARLQKNTLSV